MSTSSFFSTTGPSTSQTTAIEGSVTEAAASAAAAAVSQAAANTSASTASTAAASVSSVAADAATAVTKAAQAAVSATASETSRQASGVSAAASETSKTGSAASAATATTKAAEASASETNSAASAATSSTKAADAETARAASVAAKDASVVAKDASVAAKDASVAAKVLAVAAKVSAETAETNAANSATTGASQVTLATAQVTLATAQKVIATTKAAESSASASSASTAQAAAVAAKDAALAAFDSFDDRYLGQKSSDPSLDNDGDALAAGMLYFNTTSDVMKVYEGSSFVAAYASLSGTLVATNNLSDVANAGSARSNLGLGSAATAASSAFATASQADQTVGLTGAGATSISGTYPNFTITSTDNNTTYSVQDGELSQNNFTNADHTKLNNLDSSDYATAAQGTLAANALPKSGGTMTGALVLNNTGSVKVAAGTTGQREGSPAAGMFRYNTTEGKFEGYSTAWGEIGGGAADLKLNSFTGNGSTVAYTLSSSPVEDNTLVYVDGVYQNKTGYAIVGNVLTFSEAPANSSAIEITAATIAPVEASTEFKISQFTGNGSTVAFTLSAQSPENNTNVYIDGVYQSKSNYSVSGTTLTFSTAPPNGSAVEVMAAHAVIVSVSTPDDNTVTTAKIVNSAVTTAKIADANVTTAKIADDAITAAKIADNSVDIARLNVTDGTAGQSLTTNGSGTLAFATIGGAFNDFAIKTGNYTAVTKDQLIVNSGSAVTITLPASPSAGNVVFIKNAGTGTVTVARNGSKINSQTQDGTLAADAAATLVFVNATIGYKEL